MENLYSPLKPMPGKKLLLDKVVMVVGPTSSGKSELAVCLAKRFNGEVVSCDSRQIYKGMNLGTGKVAGIWRASLPRGRGGDWHKDWHFVYKGIIHHLIDFINPRNQYSAALFQKQAQKAIRDITARGKLPILCGGTGFWLDAVIYNFQIPNVKPNLKLRRKLEKKTATQLYCQLCKLDANRARTVDFHNKRRLVRALEIIITTGKPVPSLYRQSIYDALWIGIKTPQQHLFKKIDQRLKLRLKAGMIQEVQNLHKSGLSWKKLENFGLEYKYVSLFLQKKLSYDEMLKQLSLAIKHYAKRQITWWKRNQEIKWINKTSQAKKQVEKFPK
jgi:tRNA dimethylallyltransferase